MELRKISGFLFLLFSLMLLRAPSILMRRSSIGDRVCVGGSPESAASSATTLAVMSGCAYAIGGLMRSRRRSTYPVIRFGPRAFLES